jgi:hypothetical protein
MMVHNTQKNLLVFGLDAAALAGLPVTGNPPAGPLTGRALVATWPALVEALPALLVVPGLVLMLRRTRRLRRIGPAVLVLRRRHWLAGVILVAVGVAAVVRAWPFTREEFPPYEDFGLAPHQALIDYVDRRGGVTVWSLPEARDEGEQWVGPVRVRWRTDPYPDDLLRTVRYTAFGGLYADTTRFERPGGGWDRLLAEYLAGERRQPAWAVGEAGFHGPAGGALGAIQTVLLVDARTEAAAVEALRRGRLYALQRVPAGALVLADFAAVAGGEAAGAGATLRAAAGSALEVRVRVGAEGTVGDVRLTLVRNGAVVGAWSGAAPLAVTHREVFDGRPAVFRVEARGPVPHRLLSSPVFVRAP